MIRRFLRATGPYEFRPVPLAAIMALLFIVYSLGVYSDRFMSAAGFTLRAALPALAAGLLIGLAAYAFRCLQRKVGLSWWTYLGPIFAMAFIVPTLRATVEFLPQLQQGGQAYPLTVFRSFLSLWVITGVLGSVTTRLHQQVRETEEALAIAREQQVEIIAADEEGRRQVALMLHDRVQAGLITSCLELQVLASEVDARTRARLEPMISRLEQMRTFDVRGAARVLSPNLEDIDLQTAIAELALQFAAVVTIDIDVDPAMDLDRLVLGSGLPLAVYRIVEQGLLNAVVHAGATRIEVTVRRTAGGCRVSIADDGRGISPELRSGLGSTLVTTWARAMQGEWRWESGLDRRGTALVAELQAVELTA